MQRFSQSLIGCVLASLISLTPCVAQQQEQEEQEEAVARPSVTARRLDGESIDIDGRLDEPAWQSAQFSTGFTQQEPDDGSPATERTEVRVLYDGGAIYVGVRAFDSDPAAIRSELTRRDRVPQSDRIGIYLDSYHDRRTCFQFTVTPRGSIRDIYRFNDNQWQSDASWDPVWDVGTSIDSLGWTAEFRIPLSQLRFDRNNTTWGLQVYRNIYRKSEEVWWSPFSKESSGFTSLFGTIEGLEGLPSPMRLELLPYATVNGTRRPEGTGSRYAPAQETRGNAGFDLKYGITSDFTLDLAVNPDFGQVEADPAVVNLSAFETYFPERRPFFVEGSGLLSQYVPFGQFFYSRRIGRPPQGWADPPDGGTVQIPDASTIITAAKVTGKSASGLGLGIMSALTAEEQGTLRDSTGDVMGSEPVHPLTHHFAGRVEQDLKEGAHTFGGMVTAVNRRLRDNFDFLRTAAYAGEIDGQLRWQKNTYAVRWQLVGTHIRGSQEAITAAQRSSFRYYQRPDAPHVEVDTSRTTLSGYALSLEAAKEAGTWQYSLYYGRSSPGYEFNDMGFQWRADMQDAGIWAQYLQARPKWVFRNFRAMIGASSSWTTGGEHKSTWFRPVYFSSTFKNNWNFGLNPIAFGRDFLDVHALRGGPGLKFDTWHNSFFNVVTDRRKVLSAALNGSLGGVLDAPGNWWNIGPTLQIRPSGTLNATLSVNYSWERNPTQWVTRRTDLDTTRYILAEIERETLRLTARLNWTFTPELSLEFYAQPYVSGGTYTEFKEVVAPRADDFYDRFRIYDDELTCAGGECEVDLDGSGEADFSFGHPDFNYRALRSTTVLRWEYRPGSVVYLAWQHGRSLYGPGSPFRGVGDLWDLLSDESTNTVLIKANYWISF
jgi:hypothetical protein